MAKRKSRATWLAIDLPSNDLNYEAAGEREAEQHIEYITGKDDYKYDPTDMRFEMNHPKALQLKADKLQDILNDCTDWSKVRAKMYEYHTEAFDSCASEDLGFQLELEHDSGDTARIKLSIAKKLLRLMKRDNWEAFGEEFEPYGWPRVSLEEHRAKSLMDWESEQLGWLLRAALMLGKELILQLSDFELAMRRAAGQPTTRYVPARTEREFDNDVFQAVYNGEGEYEAWSGAVDWDQYERKVQEARADLFEELTKEEQQELIDKDLWDGVKSIPSRCPLTMELAL